MPVTYQIDKSLQLVLTTAYGVITEEDTLAHQRTLLQDPEFEPTFNQLVDMRRATEIVVSASAVLRLYVTELFAEGTRRAIVFSEQESTPGTAEFSQIVRDFGRSDIRVFNDLEEARGWLGLKP